MRGQAERASYGKLYILLTGIFAVVLCAFLMLYNGFQRALLQSVNTLSNDFIRQVNSTAATAESVLQNFSAQIFNIRSVRKLRTYETLANADMIDGIRSLNDFTASSAIIDSIYVYNGKRDYVYSTVSAGAVSDDAAKFLDQEAVRLMKYRTPDQRLMPFRRFSTSSSSSANQDMFSLLVFDIGADGAPDDNVMMMNISGRWFSELYFGKEEDYAVIADERGEPIARSDGLQAMDCAPFLNMLSQKTAQGATSGDFVLDTAGEKWLCFFARMRNQSWYYMRMAPYQKYLTGLMNVQSSTYLLLVMAFVALMVTAVVVAFRVWMPFRSIRASLSTVENAPQMKTPLEQLNALIAKSANSTRINDALKRMLRESVLSGLLLGQEKKDGAIADEYDMCLLDAAPVIPVLISSNRGEHLMAIVRPLCPRSESVSVPGEHTVLLLQPEDDEAVQTICEEIIRRNPRWYVVVGRRAEDWNELPAAYEQLLEAYQLRFLRAGESVCRIDTLPTPEASSVQAEQQSERVLEALRAGSDEDARNAYAEFIRMLGGKTYQSVAFSLTHLARAVLKLYYEVFPDALPPYQEARREFVDQLSDIGSIAVVDKYFYERFTHITEKIRQDRRNRRVQQLDEVMRAIECGYKDAGLTLQSLADAFHMSPAYLGRLFRQNYGMSVAECVTSLRVDEAKRLLKETDAKIKDFGPLIGVENAQYFFVQFKQATGMTPKQYRGQCRASDAGS